MMLRGVGPFTRSWISQGSRMRLSWKHLLAAATLLLVSLNCVSAAESEWSRNDQGEVRLVSAAQALGDSGHVQLGLEFHLNSGWKIYWRTPGDAGFPPSIDWKGSDNLAEAVMSWPAPHRFSISGLETIGYKGEVILPIIARVNDPNQPLSLHASVDYLTCDVTCVPQHADLILALPPGPSLASPHTHAISKAQSHVPGLGWSQGLSLVSAQADEMENLYITVAANPPLVKPDIFIERSDQMQFGAPKIQLEQGGKQVRFTLKQTPKTGEGDLFSQTLTITVVDGDRGMEAITDVKPIQSPARTGSLIAMLGIALLGGFILNLMPCVLPVLSIKVMGLIGHAGAERHHIRAGFLASASGIITSFLVLATGAIIIKEAGAAVGWGIQFQQPLFLETLVILLTLFAANMFGFFEIPLPQWAAQAGRGHGSPHSLAGHFLTGAFATVLATPCSAPFLGTAIGFALARGPVEILVIFATLGLGMALPYLAVATWPGIARHLPRPGRWMMVLRWLLGLVLVGTAAWLVLVLTAEAGSAAGKSMAALSLGTLAVLAAGKRIHPALRFGSILLLALTALAFSHVPQANENHLAKPAVPQGFWKPFDKDAVAKLTAANKVVFVDVTADWCLTCQVNKATVIYDDAISKRLSGPDVVAMQADWTRPDDGIAAYLASFGRYGIPFNAVYGPGAPDGIPLPELLNDEAVLQALDKAGQVPVH